MEHYLIERDDRPVFALGLNYWTREAGPLMWQRWQPEKVRAEIDHMRAIGCNVCRAFLYTPDFAPEPGALSPEMLHRLDQFLGYCAEADLGVFLTLLVGHMSGENWHPSWLQGRDIYRDEQAIEWQAWYCREIARRYRGHAAVVGWVLTNEITNYAPVPDAKSGQRWATRLLAAVREGDPTKPVGIGDGAWEAYGHDNGLRMDDLADLVDFFGPHSYAQESDDLRHAQTIPFLVELCRRGRPVLLEEFGASTAHCSPENQAAYYRETLHSAFLAGAAGAIGWCYSDFDLPHQRPYSHHPHELLFGVTDARGRSKPAALEIADFSRLLAGIDLRRWRRPAPRAALVVPSFQATWRYPFADLDVRAVNGVLLEAYILARQANIPLRLFREPPVGDETETRPWDFPAELKLLLLPHCQSLTAPGYEALWRFAHSGGTIYQSFHIDPACPNFELLFGCQHQLRYGLAETAPEVVEMTFVAAFGGLTPGDRLLYRRAGMPRRSSFCPVRPTTAKVLAVDQDGRPALLENRVGSGRIIFCTYPIEYYLWSTPNVHHSDQSHRLYRALREHSGLRPPFDGDDPWIELSWLQGDEGYLLWLINRAWQPREVSVTCPGPLRDLDGSDIVEPRIHLKPKAVRLLRAEASVLTDR